MASAETRMPSGLWRSVHDDGGGGADHFQPARRGDGGEGLLQHLGVSSFSPPPKECLERGDGHGRVLGLVGAVQRNHEVRVAPGDALDGHHLPADGHLPGFDAELHAFELERHLDFAGPSPAAPVRRPPAGPR